MKQLHFWTNKLQKRKKVFLYVNIEDVKPINIATFMAENNIHTTNDFDRLEKYYSLLYIKNQNIKHKTLCMKK